MSDVNAYAAVIQTVSAVGTIGAAVAAWRSANAASRTAKTADETSRRATEALARATRPTLRLDLQATDETTRDPVEVSAVITSTGPHRAQRWSVELTPLASGVEARRFAGEDMPGNGTETIRSLGLLPRVTPTPVADPNAPPYAAGNPDDPFEIAGCPLYGYVIEYADENDLMTWTARGVVIETTTLLVRPAGPTGGIPAYDPSQPRHRYTTRETDPPRPVRAQPEQTPDRPSGLIRRAWRRLY